MKDRICSICGTKIQGNYITYTPGENILCSNQCLITYRKKITKDEKNRN